MQTSQANRMHFGSKNVTVHPKCRGHPQRVRDTERYYAAAQKHKNYGNTEVESCRQQIVNAPQIELSMSLESNVQTCIQCLKKHAHREKHKGEAATIHVGNREG